MGKTRRSDEESKQKQILELKGKIKAQKKEITLLNKQIKSLEIRIDGKVKDRVTKVTKAGEKAELIKRLREDFKKCKI